MNRLGVWLSMHGLHMALVNNPCDHRRSVGFFLASICFENNDFRSDCPSHAGSGTADCARG